MAFSLPAPLPAPIARSRLKSNLGALALFAFLRAIFTPYISLRAVLVALLDKVLALASLQRRGSAMVWWIETLVTLSLLYNIAEAAYWVQQPPVPPPAPKGMAFVPISKSSPLTRSYPEPAATPVRSSAAQSPLAQSIYRASPNRPGAVGSPAVGSPERQSPLSSSTARILNLAQPAPSATGLFYDDTSSASPSKVARGGLGASTSSITAAPTTTSRSDFVVVERDEKEWVDNVWKGVRGKGRHIGL